MSTGSLTSEVWEQLASHGNEFTCYSAALAVWGATGGSLDWRALVNPGLWLTITEEDDGLFGFAYFRPDLHSDLGLVRRGADDAASAIEGISHELSRSGRVVVAGDGFHLPWHVAHGRAHAPHWFVLFTSDAGIEVADPFACRNELGVQEAARQAVDEASLPSLLLALPGDEPVHVLRERFAFGDETDQALEHRHQWFVHGEVPLTGRPDGAYGPEGIERLAAGFRRHGQELDAYSQADDIWSIARHRAFLNRHAGERACAAGDEALAAWVEEHAAPLAKRWGHIAPLLMQATLTLRAGREASSSVPDTLDKLAALERSAALACEENSFTIDQVPRGQS